MHVSVPTEARRGHLVRWSRSILWKFSQFSEVLSLLSLFYLNVLYGVFTLSEPYFLKISVKPCIYQIRSLSCKSRVTLNKPPASEQNYLQPPNLPPHPSCSFQRSYFQKALPKPPLPSCHLPLGGLNSSPSPIYQLQLAKSHAASLHLRTSYSPCVSVPTVFLSSPCSAATHV